MPDDPRVSQLLDELLDSHATPEEVCRSSPELLPEVRERWRRVCHVRADLDALFPTRREPDARSPDAPQAGAAQPLIPGYEVEAVLGRGGMGVVFRARHLRLGRVVALKMLLADAYAGPQERERFQREAEAVAGLRHPNVVQVYDVGESEGRPYFTMEFVEGGSLARKLAGTSQPPRQAATLLATLADAVRASHASGIIHRDLKPANVLLTADGTPKISDFGLARRLDDELALTRTGTILGTPSYMAPEQASGRGHAVGVATDVYALGAMLYELLTGRPPFHAETETETLHQVVFREPLPPSWLNGSVPRDLETICLKCLQKESHLRYAGAAALADDLHRFLRGEAITARPERRLERLARRVRRRPVLSAAVAGVTLFTAVLLGCGLWFLSERKAASRRADAEQAAIERATEEDLREMVRSQKQSDWPAATAALERARGRLGDRGTAGQRRALDQGTRDFRLVARLDEIRIAYARGNRPITAKNYDDAYEVAFRESGLGAVNDASEVVAGRVRESNISDALVDALDHWSAYAVDPRKRAWVLEVARGADPDPTGWRDRARDPDLRKRPAALVEVIRTARVDERSVPLFLALDRQLAPRDPERLPFLKRVQQAHPDDFWANITLGDVVMAFESPLAALRYHQAAVASRPRISFGYFKLGTTLSAAGLHAEAVGQFRRAVEIDPTSSFNRYFLANALVVIGNNDEAVEELRAAIRIIPDDPGLRTILGHSLEVQGQYVEALSQHQRALTLEPKNTFIRIRVGAVSVFLGKAEEARAAWLTALDADPLEHTTCDGYAEFCAFLGNEEAYRCARQSLLSRFGPTADPHVAERTARACLLQPASGEELCLAVALADRSAPVDRTKSTPASARFQFVQGLAEYRQGRFTQAITAMRGEGSRTVGPAPHLVLAMALHQDGQAEEARRTLAAAVAGHDWRPDQVRDQDGWIYHILRREAEAMIQPARGTF